MDELVYGVVRGVDVPAGPLAAPDERRLLVFAVDTRTHGAPRLLLDLADLDRLDDADLPPDAVLTPPVYALAGPAASAADAQARCLAHITVACAQVSDRATRERVLDEAEARLVGLESLSPERLGDLALLELLADEPLASPQSVVVPLAGGWEARGVYAGDGSDDPGWAALLEELLEAWLAVEAVPGRDRPWAAHDAARRRNDPAAAFGLRLEPEADLLATVDAFTRGLAERPERWDLARLEAEYRALFARLEASGRFRRAPDVSPTLPLDQWLDQQATRIEGLRRAQEGEG